MGPSFTRAPMFITCEYEHKYHKILIAAVSVFVETFEKVSVVRGHHIYKAVWTPTSRG